MAVLYMIATPIGNLEDMTFRAVRILGEVAMVFCEDTRHSRRLLDHYGIKTATTALHEHSGDRSYERVWQFLCDGQDVAYITDAGTPGVSDPGGKLVEYVLTQTKNLEQITKNENQVTIVPVPGASALTAALSIAGINLERFVFMGFPPVKNKRMKYFVEVVASECPVVFYESTYRLIKSLEQMASLDDSLRVVVCGELTKRFEKVYRGNVLEVLELVRGSDTRGEYVVVVYKS